MLTPSIGFWSMPSTMSGARNAGRLENRRHDVDHVMELVANAAGILDVAGPGDGHAIARAAEIGGDLLGPLVGRVHRPGPADGHVGIGVLSNPRRRRSSSVCAATGTSTPLKNVISLGVPAGEPSALPPLSPLM